MTNKQYKVVRIIVTIFLAIIFSQGIILENYIIPIISLIIGSLVLLILRKKVKEVVADERDYELAGKSALLAIQIYSWIAVILMIVLYSFRDINPAYEAVSMTLAYSTCLLMFSYALIFRFYNKVKFSKRKTIYSILFIILALIFAFISVRFFSGEDNWMCQNGEWVKHGNPSFPAPEVECK
jgi:uncharacterized membrane protein